MKYTLYRYYIAAVIALYAIINILIFVLVDFNYLNHAPFWISWAFMFGVNSAGSIFVLVALRRKNANEIRFAPVGVLVGGNVVYFILGLIFTLLMPSIIYVIAADVIALIVYALLIYRFVLYVRYIRDNDAYKRKKVAYIRQMTAMVDGYSSLTGDPDISDEIKKLASDFRYSDPMSHESLENSESKLLEMVIRLEDTVRGGDASAISADIDEIKRELKYRNTMCANLK